MISVDINQLEQGIFSGYFVLNHYLTTKQWLSNPSTIFHFTVAFAVTLASRYICFEYPDRVKSHFGFISRKEWSFLLRSEEWFSRNVLTAKSSKCNSKGEDLSTSGMRTIDGIK